MLLRTAETATHPACVHARQRRECVSKLRVVKLVGVATVNALSHTPYSSPSPSSAGTCAVQARRAEELRKLIAQHVPTILTMLMELLDFRCVLKPCVLKRLVLVLVDRQE